MIYRNADKATDKMAKVMGEYKEPAKKVVKNKKAGKGKK
jgi:hypothetical protein